MSVPSRRPPPLPALPPSLSPYISMIVVVTIYQGQRRVERKRKRGPPPDVMGRPTGRKSGLSFSAQTFTRCMLGKNHTTTRRTPDFGQPIFDIHCQGCNHLRIAVLKPYCIYLICFAVCDQLGQFLGRLLAALPLVFSARTILHPVAAPRVFNAEVVVALELRFQTF